MNPQIIKAPNGDELVVLTRAEYDALVAVAEPYDEDADDAEEATEDIARHSWDSSFADGGRLAPAPCAHLLIRDYFLM